MEDCGIVFHHYLTNEVTHKHLDLIRKHNPDAAIITLSAGDPLPGGYSMRDVHSLGDAWQKKAATKEGQLRNVDLMFYQWYLIKNVYCKKWVFVEYDTRCNMGMKEFFGSLWDSPSVVAGRVHDATSDWGMKKEWKLLPDHIKQYAMGLDPLSCLLFDDSVFSDMVFLLKNNFFDAWCETRIATLANAVGYKPIQYIDYKGRIQWNQFEDDFTKAGFWHPVKK